MRRLSRIFRTVPSASSPNEVLGPGTTSDGCMGLIEFAHFMVITAHIIMTEKMFASFSQLILQYKYVPSERVCAELFV